MFTPQQIDQISFTKATFGGYNMQQVDEFLEPLTEDYVTLYKENALLKSKMRVLVSKLEEYRKNEATMKEAVLSAQKAADIIIRDAQESVADLKAEAEAILSAAKGEATVIKQDAEKQAIVDSDLLMNLAKDKAEDIINKAKEKAHGILIAANNSANGRCKQNHYK